ncbi:MAG TPA: metal ABC transporter substrate-binding protein [Acidimicrobiia bacterium]
MITILIPDKNPRTRRRTVTGLLLGLTIVLAACGSPGTGGADDLTIVATTSIWGDVVSQLVGDDAEVEVLIPRGSDPHDYQTSSSQVATLHAADLVIANGLGLEEGLHDVLESAKSDGVAVFEVGPLLDPLPFSGEDDHEGDEESEESHDEDPHVWLDPQRVSTAADFIAQRLAEIEPSVDWQARANEYVAELEQTDSQIATTLAAVPDSDRKLVTNHDALGYFADRYGFEVIGVVIPGGSTLSDPSSAALAALVAEIEHEGVHAIFAETTQPTRLAEAVAAEVGSDVSVVELYTGSLGEPGSGAETLVGMLLTDTTLIADALAR